MCRTLVQETQVVHFLPCELRNRESVWGVGKERQEGSTLAQGESNDEQGSSVPGDELLVLTLNVFMGLYNSTGCHVVIQILH